VLDIPARERVSVGDVEGEMFEAHRGRWFRSAAR
jgi:hypothetical protein